MKLNSLFLKNFRNIEELNLDLSPRLNIFVGDNGQGKTNIIESVHYLIEGESFRYGQNSTMIQFGYPFSLIKTTIQNNELEYQVLVRLFDKKKEILINEKKAIKLEQYLPPIILFSPESLSIIKESSDERRNLLDQLVISTTRYGKTLILDFKKALRTRNKLLKDISEGKVQLNEASRILESLNPIYFNLAAKLAFQRISALKNIKNEVQQTLEKIETLHQAEFDFNYVISDQNCVDNSEENLLNFMKKRAQELFQAEISSGVSLVGPQKHDVIFLYNGKDSRFFCSQGQQRSIILAFKIAQIVYHHRVNGFYPVLLLDDVLSELDQNKQGSLVKALNEIETQTFLTSTDADVLKKLNVDKTSVFNIRNGKIL